ncbi:hypothetical protein [Tautonia sociabilis]|uniref:Uncharacterized protein n=1 Tax=Tautonia sociabilis TaxID=2080755 RepID=A0A432MIR7_9BACT|nr:hypothetical protein [Tautonia sociabilis]RUL87264.1 hypothetical protein TsocGM_12835 [Tautonia sociabilis]
MREASQTVLVGIILIGASLAIVPGKARGQSLGMRRSLGGYGAAALPSAYGQRGGPMIPYAGGQGGFIPYQSLESPLAGSGMAMRPQRIEVTTIGGAGMMGPPIGGASRMVGPILSVPSGVRRVMVPRSRPVGRGAIGPGLGSPFRRPPILMGGGM